MIELKVKLEALFKADENKIQQQSFADETKKILASIGGDVSVSFEEGFLTHQYQGIDQFRDVATISIPSNDYGKIFDVIINNEGMDRTRKLIYSELQKNQKQSIYKAECQAKRDRLASLLKGAVFKELRDNDVVFALPNGQKVVISTEYDPWLNIYIDSEPSVIQFNF